MEKKGRANSLLDLEMIKMRAESPIVIVTIRYNSEPSDGGGERGRPWRRRRRRSITFGRTSSTADNVGHEDSFIVCGIVRKTRKQAAEEDITPFASSRLSLADTSLGRRRRRRRPASSEREILVRRSDWKKFEKLNYQSLHIVVR